MIGQLTRREMLKTSAALAAGAAIGGSRASWAASAPESIGRRRVLRVAHLTDVHVQPERAARDGMAACLHHLQSAKEKPDLILFGGDCIMDSFESDNFRTQLQWNLWNSVLKNECSIPFRPCIGNHDVWGWKKSAARTTGEEPNYGKKRAMENLGLAERFHSFDQGGWHFIALDSTQPDPNNPDSYIAYVDEAQMDWLTKDLAAVDAKTPVLLFSHIPILSITPIGWAKEKPDEFRIDFSLMHRDSAALRALFARHPNVKACVSGHMHLVDRVEYGGVTYLCDGAVCGNWWKGRHKDCDEGYALLDLYDDGSLEREYVKYGWQARE